MASIHIPTTTVNSDVTVSVSSANYLKKIDEVGDVLYVGQAVPSSSDLSAVWQIQRITTTGPDIVIEWADGSTSFNNIWNNRLSLSYS